MKSMFSLSDLLSHFQKVFESLKDETVSVIAFTNLFLHQVVVLTDMFVILIACIYALINEVKRKLLSSEVFCRKKLLRPYFTQMVVFVGS